MKEYLHKIWQKLRNMNASTYAIAAGFACGVAVSFTPFVGFHSLLAVITAFFIRASIAAALVGTLFGNPLTFPLIWAGVLYLGELLLKRENHNSAIDFEDLFSRAFEMIKKLDFSGFLQDIWPVLYPMIIGSIPFCLLSWIIAYIVVRKLLNKSKG